MSKSKFFVIASSCFAAGILLGSLFSLRIEILYGAAAAVCVFAIGSSKMIRYVAVFLLCLGLGVWRMNLAAQQNSYALMFDSSQSLDGKITADPDVREDRQQLYFRPDGFCQDILLVTRNDRKYFYGDRVWVRGKIIEPENFNNFDYQGYLERYNIFAMMRQPRIIVLKQKQGSLLTTWLLEIKYAYIRRINLFIAEPRSTLLLGILIGARRALPQTIQDDFSTTGTSHIIAISGYNISIVVTALDFLARLVGRRASFALSLLLILAFVVVSGASASVIRAAVMGSLLLVSFSIGRLYSALPAVCAASVAMLIINPRIFYWDLSFQLSFAATLGIMYIAPLLERVAEKLPDFLGVKSILITTFAAIIATMPLIAAQFGTMSLIAPIVNILVLPVVPATMLFGFLAWLPGLGGGFAFVANILLSYLLFIVQWFARVPNASVGVQISRPIMALCYVGLVAAFLGLKWYIDARERRLGAKLAPPPKF